MEKVIFEILFSILSFYGSIVCASFTVRNISEPEKTFQEIYSEKLIEEF